jgi:DNA-binding MarR family transcriptional regulator
MTKTATELPPSAQYVLDVLETHGDEITRQELQRQTYLADRTLDAALETLKNCEFISKSRQSSDLRQVVVRLAEERAYNTPDSEV